MSECSKWKTSPSLSAPPVQSGFGAQPQASEVAIGVPIPPLIIT